MGRTFRLAVLAMLVGMSFAAVAVAAAGPRPWRQLHYHGASFQVPAGWPVYDLQRRPTACLRFDRHAVFLGPASPQERCPAELIGRTETLWLQPDEARAASAALPATTRAGGDAGQLRRAGGAVLVSATWNRHPELILRALGLKRLPSAGGSVAAARAAGAAAPRASSAAVNHLGFDPCATPSAGAMRAWLSSPYRTVGVYLGGVNMACAQPNLTAGWVTRETAAGWRFIPTYVGLQAPGNSCGCAAITPRQAAAQGRAAAADALTRAQAVGLGAGNPIYYDMEAYGRGGGVTAAVLRFLGAWTKRLHRAGYVSGVYSSGASGIQDLVQASGTSFTEPDDLWIADWNDARTAQDPYVPGDLWTDHHRLHQFSGDRNLTYGGVTINIDGDYIDGATAIGGRQIPDGTFVTVDGSTVYRVAGGAPLWVFNWDAFGGPQPLTRLSPAQFAALAPVPADGTFLSTAGGAAYRVVGGYPFPVTDWDLFGGPQPAITIDPWDLQNLGAPPAHLRQAPSDGTRVRGLPSGSTWQFQAGSRAPAAARPKAVAVEDAALAPFPVDQYAVAPTAVPACLVPRLQGLTLPGARRRISRAHCAVGQVHRPAAAPGQILRVSAQTPPAGTTRPGGWRVGLTLR